MSLKQRIPLLRWSFLRMAAGARNITTTGQIGDGREAAAVEYVLKHARAGDIDDVLATIDRFAYQKSMLINVGYEKGALLDAAVHRANPKLALELGTYVGSSGQGVLGRASRGQRRQCPPNLGACRCGRSN
jgi:catechol O-methyltransferase